MTAYIKADFKAPMRPLCAYYLVGSLDRVEGRKIFSSGKIIDGSGKVYATAEALQIMVNEVQQEEQIEQSRNESAFRIQEARAVSAEFTAAQDSLKTMTVIDDRTQRLLYGLSQQALFGNCQDSTPRGS